MGRRALPNPLTIHHRNTEQKEHTMKRTILAGALALGLAVAGAVIAPTAASAHTPEVTASCTSISATLTNYEYVPGSPAEVGTRVVTPEVPAIPGTNAIPAVYGPTLYEYAHADHGNGNSNKTRWEVEGWNAGDNGKGWVPTGATQPGALITAEVPAVPEIPAVPAVTEQYEVKPAVAEQANTITLVLDGEVVAGPITFGTSYQGTYPLTGTKAHAYSVVIDAIGTQYDKTIKGKTTVCPPVEVTVPIFEPTPPTCDTAGSLPFLGNPAAQNPNGYEFPGQGFRVYVSPAFTGAGEYTLTIQKIGAGFDPAFPYGTKVTGETKQVLTVLPATGVTQSTDSEGACYVAPPVEEEPPVEEPPVVVPPVVEPPVVVPEAVPAALVAPIVSDGVGGDEPTTLAQTGGGVSPIAIGGGALALLAGLALLITRRRTTA